MAGVKIVTDSACDLTPEEIEANNIAVVPLSIRFGDEEFVDLVDLGTVEFYDKMAESDHLPETAAPAPGKFAAEFAKAAQEGADAVVCINLSSQLSATMQSAQTAAGDFDTIPVHVVDSRSITGGLGMQVLGAAAAAKAGATADEIVEMVADWADRTRVYAALDTLDNLKKGGRIGAAQAMVGTLLSIKPLIDVSSGTVEEAGRQRTRKKAMVALRDNIEELGELECLSLMHGNADDFSTFLDLVSANADLPPIRTGLIGAVIGAHGGPRVLGVALRVK